MGCMRCILGIYIGCLGVWHVCDVVREVGSVGMG